MDPMQEKLQEYAKLLIQVGLHVEKGQTLVISSPVECAFFARLCATAAYDAGCREVVMNWHDDYLARENSSVPMTPFLTRCPCGGSISLTTMPIRAPLTCPLTPRTRSISRAWTRTAVCAPSG